MHVMVAQVLYENGRDHIQTTMRWRACRASAFDSLVSDARRRILDDQSCNSSFALLYKPWLGNADIAGDLYPVSSIEILPLSWW